MAKCLTFVGDWLRIVVQQPRISVIQQGNVAWIARLLAPALDACGISWNIVMPSSDAEEFAAQLADPALLRSFAKNPAETWAAAYEGGTGSDCLTALFDAVPMSGLVVGFEIPPFMKREFAARRMDYISLHIHPVRFLKDFMFSAYTNAPDLAASLAAISCDPQEIARRVSRFSARLARLDPVQTRLPEGVPVLFGQTAADSSLIAKDRFMRLQDYVEPLAMLLNGHDEVAFLKHPLAEWRADEVRFLTRDLGKTVLGISGNSYAHVMSPSCLGPVTAISSSLGVEAGLFGHDCRFLLADPRDKFVVPEQDDPRRVQLDHRLFEPAFWHEIMRRTGRGIGPKPDSFHLGADYVRGTLQDYSLEGLEGARPLPPMEKLILPAAGITPARVDELAGRLAGAALNDREQAIVRGADYRIELRLAPAPLAAGQTWTWNSSAALPGMFLSGFHPVEEHGAWSGAPVCAITVPLDGPDELELDCEADLSFFSGILDRNPALLVRVDGKPVSALCQIGTEMQKHQLSWTMPVRGPGDCVMQIECSHSVRPRDLGMQTDERELGFMLHRLVVQARPLPRLETLTNSAYGG